ncbi:decaprenyl-phosphate phosphoribosyltransferase [Candidatus Woesebacteria bacterium]|nr:decaprenyl-phosphate phosphoribosyltransferase [Candidatus Woesebacteria bacterium]
MVKLFIAIVKTARLRQWIKNIAFFAALLFTGNLFNPELLTQTFLGFLTLSVLVSSVYFINDIVDAPLDRLHPFKKKRPIANGTLPIPAAVFLAITMVAVSLYSAFLLSQFFFLALLAYLALQLLYTFWLKGIVVGDILAIAAGFVLRIYAGAFLIDAHLSIWFLLCVISVSLFLAAGKRRAEFAILAESVASQHRKTLSRYSHQLLDGYLAMFATASWLSWALFTFFQGEERVFYLSQTVSPKLLDILPLTILGSGKLLMVTIPIVIFGIMRYLYIVYEGAKAESPERILISDKVLLSSVFIWGVLVIVILYGGLYPSA